MSRRPRADPPRADLGLRQDRPRRARRARSSARGVELISTGGTAQALRDAGLPVRDVARADRLPRDARRPGEDAAPDGARRPARACATTPEHAAALDDVRHRDDRPARRQPLPVRGDGGGRRRLRRLHREHRHRRPGDAALGGEEPRASSPSSPTSRTTRPLLAELDAQRRRHHARLPPGAGADRLRPHRRLRRGGLGLARRRRSGEAAPRRRELRRRAGAAAALRREPAPGGRLLPRRQRPARGRHRAPAAGQGAQLQQHQRHRRRLRAGRRVRARRRAGLRHHQARQPLRRRARRDACSRPTAPPTTATAPRPSAASSR